MIDFDVTYLQLTFPMAYCSLTNDVFISYAHTDNTEGWVDRFHERLLNRLRQFNRACDFAIWRDSKLSGSDIFTDNIESQLKSSGIFIFSPDGKTVASASYDHTVRLWDVGTRRLLGVPLNEHAWNIDSVAFSPDGKLLVSAGGDGMLKFWPMDPESWIARSCSIVNRNLSVSEWQQQIGPDIPHRKTCPDLPPGDGDQKASPSPD